MGSHLVENLVAEGNQVIVLDDLSNGSLNNLRAVRKDITLLRLDASKESSIRKIGKLDGIFHLACHPRSFSFHRPARDVDVNLRSTINMLEVARKHDAKLVFTSNSGIYGEPQHVPMDEEHPIDCKTPYDVNKYASELQIRAFVKEFALKSVVCRLASVYGPRQKVNEKLGWRPVVATFVNCFVTRKPPVVFGDGEQTRDLIYVKDVVDGLVKAFNSEEAEGEAFNLSTGVETSVNCLLQMISDVFGIELHPERGPPSIGDIRHMCYSNLKAQRIFKFEVKYPLSVALKGYVAWARVNIGHATG